MSKTDTTSQRDIRSPSLYRAMVAEILGTMFLVLVSCGACTGNANVVQISLAFGLSVATMVWAIANVSGGHINPCVTIGFLVTRRISIVRGVFYFVSQLVGGIAGAGILKALTPEQYRKTLGATVLADGVTAGQGFGIELLITFVLVFTVFATCDGGRKDLNGSGPLAIGLSVAMCHLWAVPYTGAGMNVARSFGPAVVQGGDLWNNHWVYWIAQLLAGVLAALLYEFLFAANASVSKIRMCATSRSYGAGEEYQLNGSADPNASGEPLKDTKNASV